MFGMFIETGTLVFLSLAVLVWRLPRRTMLWLFGHPVYLELPFGFVAYALHYGTFSGMMAAATAAIMCFAFVQLGRSLVGYIDKGQYKPGMMELKL
jgi:hypothetical protein